MIEVPMSGWFGQRFAFLKFRTSLKRTSASFSWLSLKRTAAKLFIDFPMPGSVGFKFSL